MSAPRLTSLRSRLRGLPGELVKFGAVGGAGVLVNFAVFNFVRHVTDLPVVRCSMIATFAAIIFNYMGFRYFTYRERDKSGRTREFTLFLVFSAIGLVIENGVLYVATYGFHWDSPLQNNVFKFLGIGVASLFRFWSYRTWVFRVLPGEAGAGKGDGSPVVEQAGSAEPALAAGGAGRTGAGRSG